MKVRETEDRKQKTVSKTSKSSEPQTMAQLLEEEKITLHGLKKGEEIEGVITALSSKGIIVDIGAKTEALVLEKDKKILSDLLLTHKLGEKIKATVLVPESDEGYTLLSLRRQRKNRAWQLLQRAQEGDETVDVTVTDLIRGGLLAEYTSLHGFIPLSQLNSNTEEIVGKNLKVKVLEAVPADNRLIFSEKAALTRTEDVKKELAKVKVNDVYTGTITSLARFGLFVKIGENLEGLVHISEVSWEAKVDLEEQFKVGEEIQVLAIGVDVPNKKLNLSIKQLLPDPWKEVVNKLATDQQVQGKISKISGLGLHIVLGLGIEGLIHRSKIPLGADFTEGDKITCLVAGVDLEKRRVSLAPILKEKPVGYR